MCFESWMLAAMEEAGYGDTNEALLNRVANHLSDSPNDVIDTSEFRSACMDCGVDPDSFTQDDLEKLQSKLK